MNDVIRITSDPISLDEVVRLVGHQSCSNDDPCPDRGAGAVVTFSGVVRGKEGIADIDHLDYEHYEGMAQKHIERLFEQAREKWPIHQAAVFHRVGAVRQGEPSVIIAVSAGHRAEAFEAARFLIDELKKQVPIWKTAPIEPGKE